MAAVQCDRRPLPDHRHGEHMLLIGGARGEMGGKRIGVVGVGCQECGVASEGVKRD